MLKPRTIEEKMLILLRQGKVSKWFSGIGQEAISVGLTAVLDQDEYILPMHRNLAVFTMRDIPLYRLFSQWQGKANGFTKGRDRSFHFGTQEYNIVGMISHLGPQLGVADGIALANKLSENGKVTVFVNKISNHCWQRFYICKEIIHVAASNSENVTLGYDKISSVLENIQARNFGVDKATKIEFDAEFWRHRAYDAKRNG